MAATPTTPPPTSPKFTSQQWDRLRSRVTALMHDKGLSNEEARLIAVRVVSESANHSVQATFNSPEEFTRSYQAFIANARDKLKLPSAQANAIVVAWAAALFQQGLEDS